MVDVGLVTLQIAGFVKHFPYHFLIAYSLTHLKWLFRKNGKLTDVESTLVLKNSNKDHHERRFSCRITQGDKEITTLVAENLVNVRWAPENTIVNGAEEFLELNEAEITCQSKCLRP